MVPEIEVNENPILNRDAKCISVRKNDSFMLSRPSRATNLKTLPIHLKQGIQTRLRRFILKPSKVKALTRKMGQEKSGIQQVET